jgi:hypothetical protein
MRLCRDNKSTNNIAHNPMQRHRTNHFEADKRFIKENLESGLVCTPYVNTQGQLADVLTKGPSSTMFWNIVYMLGMVNTFISLRGSIRMFVSVTDTVCTCN